jgi:hypothetical protein
VRDPAGKLADGFHFLHLIELTLEPFPIGKHRRQLRFALPQRDGNSPLGVLRRGLMAAVLGGFNDVLTPGVLSEQRLYQRTGVGIRIDHSKTDGAGSALSHTPVLLCETWCDLDDREERLDVRALEFPGCCILAQVTRGLFMR